MGTRCIAISAGRGLLAQIAQTALLGRRPFFLFTALNYVTTGLGRSHVVLIPGIIYIIHILLPICALTLPPLLGGVFIP